MRALYPEISPYRSFDLDTGEGHQLHVAEAGNDAGTPLLFLHGGPGMGYAPEAARLFDPSHYRIILFDQRGAARSRPLGSIEANTTAHLVQDIEAIRAALGIARWIVAGGSWGSALALTYAAAHRDAVRGLILRGIFLGTRAEDQWQYQSGAHRYLPEAFAAFQQFIPAEERHDLIGAYHARVFGPDQALAGEAAQAFSIWAARTNTVEPDHEEAALLGQPWLLPFVLAGARIALHYAVNGSFLEGGPLLLERARTLDRMPTAIIHGTHDYACPPASAEALARAMPHAEFQMIEKAGHSAKDPLIRRAVLEATDRFRNL